MKTTLVTVVTGEIYEKFAEDLFSSAEEFFFPTVEVDFLMLPGVPGWPEATMFRHQALLDRFPDSDYVYLCDADMLFVSETRHEILPRRKTIVATLHPGYIDRPRVTFPYETNPNSACCVDPFDGDNYYCGGFWGGHFEAVRHTLAMTTNYIGRDLQRGLVPRWHDESALNRFLADFPPEKDLSPSYCYPDDDTYYKTFWKDSYVRKLVALDKTPIERVGR